jgi:hypothetical protein
MPIDLGARDPLIRARRLLDPLFRSWQQRRFDESRSAPPEIYHYTATPGLLGMASSNVMWASDVRHLNDTAEVLHGMGILADILETSFTNEGGLLGRTLQWVQSEMPNLFDLMEVFVTCFCEHDDVNSQWITYSGAGGGFSLGFDAHMVARHPALPVVPQSFEFVRYDEQLKRDFLREPLDQVRAVLLDLTSVANGYDAAFARTAGSILAGELAQRLAVVKNRSFIAEFEWRFVFAQSVSDRILPVYTDVKPHVELRLRNNDHAYKDILPLVSLTRGAIPAPHLNLVEARHLLQERDYPVAQIAFRESQTSYNP